jgi:hypothetical protein
MWQLEQIQSPHNLQWNVSIAKMINNEMFSITKLVAIENILSLIVWRFVFLGYCTLGHLIDNGLISTIDLVTKFGMYGNKM